MLYEKPWWELPVGQAVTEVKRIREQYHSDFAWRRTMAVQLASRYHGRDLSSFAGSLSRVEWERGVRDEGDEGLSCPLVRNKYYEYTETIVAMVGAADEPKPALMLTDATWTQKKKAKLNSRILEAEYSMPQGMWPSLNALGMHGLRLSWCTGSVAAKVYPWPEEERVIVELHDTLDMFLDESETLYGTPRTLGNRTYWPRYRLMAAFPDAKAAIADAPASRLDTASLSLTGRHPRVDLVPVTEVWATRGLDGSPGKHLAFLEDDTVLPTKPFNKKRWPFAFFHASPQMTGFWGIPPLDLVDLEIQAVNEILHEMDECHSNTPKATHYVHPASLDDMQDITQVRSVTVVRTKSPTYKPTIINPPAFPETSPELLRNHEDGIARTLGISEMRSAGAAQPGLPSALAQREARAASDGRAASTHRNYNQWLAVDIGRLVLEAQRELADSVSEFSRKWEGDSFSREIKAEDFLDLDVEALHVQVKATGGVKGTPQERVQYAEELLEKNAIPIDAYMRMLEHYDTPGELSAVGTQRKWVAWQIEKWLMIGEDEFRQKLEEERSEEDDEEEPQEFYQSPRQWMNKPDALVQTVEALMQAEMDGAPQSALQYFLDFISELSNMIVAKAGPEMPLPSGPMPEGIPEGALPPQGAPPPMAGGGGPGPVEAGPPPAQTQIA